MGHLEGYVFKDGNTILKDFFFFLKFYPNSLVPEVTSDSRVIQEDIWVHRQILQISQSSTLVMA